MKYMFRNVYILELGNIDEIHVYSLALRNIDVQYIFTSFRSIIGPGAPIADHLKGWEYHDHELIEHQYTTLYNTLENLS